MANFNRSSYNFASQAEAYEEDYLYSLLHGEKEEEVEEEVGVGYFDTQPKVKGIKGLEALHKIAQLELSKVHSLEKWSQGSLPWQQILFLKAAQYGTALRKAAYIISPCEWENRQLNKQSLIQLGIKGSPKLSKVLVALGLPNKVMELLLSAPLNKKTNVSNFKVTNVRTDYLACKEQGNSIYYSSCQATDSRSAWKGSTQYNKTEEDIPYFGKSLFLWTVGDCMSQNGSGFKARAKLRIMYNNKEATCVAGLYIDRPYGQHSLLMDNLHELQEWWDNYCEEFYNRTFPIFIPPVWNRDDGAGNDFQGKYGGYYHKKLFCPSALGGYQDTLTRGLGGYDCFKEVGSKSTSLLMQAYLLRPKSKGAYKVPLLSVGYNPQKGGLIPPVVNDRPWRGIIDHRARAQMQAYLQYIGKPESRFVLEDTWYHESVQCTLAGKRVKFVFDNLNWSVKNKWNLELIDHHINLLSGVVNYDNSTEVEVNNDFPELGFWKAISLP